MKKLISTVVLLILSIATYAQADVTKFLGIPVDGTKSEMIQKLKAKGFRESNLDREVLTGEFNGSEVDVYVVTNRNKVWRIMLTDKMHQDEGNIKIRFNNLCSQFENNKKYMKVSDTANYILSEKEDISYEMLVHKKRYQASYFQCPENLEEDVKSAWSEYTEEQLKNMTEEQLKEKVKDLIVSEYEKCSKKSVWFMISSYYGKYYITMFYDNEYNHSNGEDL